MDCLALDARPHALLHGCGRYKIDRSTQNLLEVVLQIKELERTDGAIELDKDVDVAVVCHGVPSGGSKETQGRDAARVKQGRSASKAP